MTTSSTTSSLVLAVNLLYTDLKGNNNKFWNVRFDGAQMTRHWGRVGSMGETQTEPATRSKVETLIAQKRAKGYEPVPMADANVVAVPSGVDPEVGKFLSWIGLNATRHINTYFTGNLDAMDPDHIERARRVLIEIQDAHGPRLMELANDYYRMIPTKLPGRIDPTREAIGLKRTVAEQEERLDQLLVAARQVRTVEAGVAPVVPFTAVPVPQRDTRFGKMVDWVKRTNVHNHSFNPVAYYDIEIPWERQRYEGCTIDNEEYLFHGTALQNVQHILSLGLKVPKTESNGRMFGDGVYMARHASKSMQYTKSDYGTPRMMLVVSSKLGKSFPAPKDSPYRQAPAGYDSVWGKAGFTDGWNGKLRFDELIVYKPEQVTIRGVFCFS